MADIKEYSKYVYVILLLGILYLSYIVIRPFILAIIASAILVYMFYPLHKRLSNRIKRKNLAAFIMTIFVLLIITVPLIFAVNAITKEAYIFYFTAKQKIASKDFPEGKCFDDSFVCNSINRMKEKISDPEVRFYIENGIQRITSYIIDSSSRIPSKLAGIAVNLFVVFFVMFFLFRDGANVIEKTAEFIPIKKFHKKRILKRFDDMIHAVIYGSILTALVQGAVGALGFFIFGVPSPLLWGMVMVIAALIPLVGTPLIWAPAGLYLIFSGYLSGESIIIIKGVGLLLYGAIIISSIDNFLKPKIIGSRGKVHPVLVLLGVLGGLKVFGLMGFVIGPLVLGFCVVFFEIYKEGAV